MTKLFIFLFCGLLSVTGCTEKENPDEDNTKASGTTGELTWTLSTDGTLTISGKGAMPDYTVTYPDDYCRLCVVTVHNPWNYAIISVVIKGGVTSIGNNAFSRHRELESVSIPNSVTSIGNNAFYLCGRLKSVTIPYSVISIEDAAFYGCSGLIEIFNNGIVPQTIHSNVFAEVDKSTCTLCVPEISIKAYRKADVWKDFVNIKAIE